MTDNLLKLVFLFCLSYLWATYSAHAEAGKSIERLMIFRTFLGVSINTTVDEAIAKFGQPERVRVASGSGKSVYHFSNNQLTIYFDRIRQTATTLVLRLRINKALPEGVYDKKEISKAFIGRRPKDIIDYFGTPNSISAGLYIYHVRNKTVDFLVRFSCKTNDTCNGIWIQWFKSKSYEQHKPAKEAPFSPPELCDNVARDLRLCK